MTSDTSTATLLYPATASELCINGFVTCFFPEMHDRLVGSLEELYLRRSESTRTPRSHADSRESPLSAHATSFRVPALHSV